MDNIFNLYRHYNVARIEAEAFRKADPSSILAKLRDRDAEWCLKRARAIMEGRARSDQHVVLI